MSYTNEDLAATPYRISHLGRRNYAALWVSMSLCIPTYMLSSSLIEGGMNWWQAILTVFLGNTIVLIPMVLNGHAGRSTEFHFLFLPALVLVEGSQYSRPSPSGCRLRLVWNSNLDRWIRSFSNRESLVAPGLQNFLRFFQLRWDLKRALRLHFFFFGASICLWFILASKALKKLLLFKAVFLAFGALSL